MLEASRRTANTVAKATNAAIDYFEQQVGMEVSQAKSAITATNSPTARLASCMIRSQKGAPIGPKGKTHAKMLGVGTVGGAKRTTVVQQQRLKQFATKRNRYKALKKAGFCVRTLTRATAMPAIGYGLECHGIADHALRKTRREVLAAMASNTSGGDMDTEWYTRDGTSGKNDPAFDAHVLPLETLATAWWENWIPQNDLEAAHEHAMARLQHFAKGTAPLWSRVTGPTAAAILTAARLGWVFETARTITTDEGTKIDLGRDSPARVKQFAEESVIRWRTANVLESFTQTRHLLRDTQQQQPQSPGRQPEQEERYGGDDEHTSSDENEVATNCSARTSRPDNSNSYSNGTSTSSLLPGAWSRARRMAQVMHHADVMNELWRGSSSRDWQANYKPHLLSAMAGKQWPQAKVASVKGAQWVQDSLCKLCRSTPGTLEHRHHCPATSPHAHADPMPTHVTSPAAYCSSAEKTLWQTRGIGATRVFIPPRQTEATINWLRTLRPDAEEAKLTWYVDASLIDGKLPGACRLGAAAVATDDRGHLMAAVSAVPPAFVRTIGEAEAWAVWLVLNSTATRRAIYTDCRANLTIASRGRQWATHAKRPYARVWNAIYAAVDDDEQLTRA